MIEFSNTNIDYSKSIISISTILDMLETPFDQKGVAEKTCNKYFNDPNSQYFQKTVDQICEMWTAKGAESCRYGSLLDDYIGVVLTGTEDDMELYKLDNDIDGDTRLAGLVQSFDDFYALLSKSGDMEFVTREQTLYLKVDENHYVKGRFDALFKNKRTGKWVVIDWKSSGDVDKVPNKWTQTFLGPAKIYPALNWYRYTNQLYFYKRALIEGGYLPEGTTYDDIEVMIVQLPGHTCDSGLNYAIHKPAFIFDTEWLDKVYVFGIKKNEIMNRKCQQ